MRSPEIISQPPNERLRKIASVIANSEREIQKELMSTGQPWINLFMTQWNAVKGQLDLAKMFGDVDDKAFVRASQKLNKIQKRVDGINENGEKIGESLIEVYQGDPDKAMPEDIKRDLLELLDIMPAIYDEEWKQT